MSKRLVKLAVALLAFAGVPFVSGCGKSDGTNPAPAPTSVPASSSQPDTTRPSGPASPKSGKTGGVAPPPI